MTEDATFLPLDVLACEIEARPKGAPGIADVAVGVLSVERERETLLVSFDPAMTAAIEAFVAAEQRCCASLSWRLDTSGGATRLSVVAQPQQIDLLEQLFTQVR